MLEEEVLYPESTEEGLDEKRRNVEWSATVSEISHRKFDVLGRFEKALSTYENDWKTLSPIISQLTKLAEYFCCQESPDLKSFE